MEFEALQRMQRPTIMFHSNFSSSMNTSLTRSYLGNQMDHYRVKVCTGGTHCVECGKMPTASDRYWVQSDCPVGTKGDGIEIRTDHNTDYLQFCEVEITGLGMYDHSFEVFIQMVNFGRRIQ